MLASPSFVRFPDGAYVWSGLRISHGGRCQSMRQTLSAGCLPGSKAGSMGGRRALTPALEFQRQGDALLLKVG